jgi:hypothetical protein
MNSKMSTNRSSSFILAFFLGVCLLNPPAFSTENLKPEPTSLPTPKVQVTGPVEFFTPAPTEVPKQLRKPVPAKWYAGKKILKDVELSYLLYQAGFRGKEHRLAWIVAMGESTGRPKAFNGHCCHGLFQINMSGNLKADRLKRYGLKSVADLYNPLVNSKVAFKMSRKGTNWSAWTVNPYKRSGAEYPGVVTKQPK